MTEEHGVSFWAIVRKQLRKNHVAMFGFYSVMGLLFIAIYAPVIASDRPFSFTTPDGTTHPWFTDLFDRVQVTQPVDLFFNLLMIFLPPAALLFFLWRGWRRRRGAWDNRSARRSLGLLALVFLWLFAGIYLPDSVVKGKVAQVVLAPGLALRSAKPAVDYHEWEAQLRAKGQEVEATWPVLPYHYDRTRNREAALPPDWFGGRVRTELGAVGTHPLGTDPGGKDVITIGIILGSLAGYFLGWVDGLISRLVEIMICFPLLFFVLTIVSVFETRSIFLIMAAIGVTAWPGVARLVRGEFLKQRNIEYVTAAQSLGIPQRKIIFRHVLPNALTPVLVAATFGIAAAILTESAIAFLGLGDTTTASWGLMLNKGRQTRLDWLILAPGAAIFFTVTAFNLLGEGLRDALDPKMRA
ncbi:MAG: ABC transporter permease [Planctomycetota bacterium]|jgi:ABC-type dipeptide/oligopeptide/nickel transport system permease subunit